MSTQMIVRIDPELKSKVSRFAKGEGKTSSEVVRELLEDYIRSRDPSAYIDDLWNRIGAKLSSGKVSQREIKRAIQEVRKQK